MKQSLSFKEYLDTKAQLKSAGENCPRVKRLYEARKYCKIPLTEDMFDDKKQYISLKPKDKIEILWEYISIENPTPKHIMLTFDDDQIMHFSWSDAKIRKWVETTLTLI